MSNVIRALGLSDTDTTHLKFPIGLYTSRAMLRGEHPFAVIYEERGKPKLRVGCFTDLQVAKSKIVVD